MYYYREKSSVRTTLFLTVSLCMHVLGIMGAGIFIHNRLADPGEAQAVVEQQGQYDALLNTLTLEEKIGQMLMGSFSGTDAEEALSLIDDFQIGGIILFKDNISSVENTAALTRTIQDHALERTGVYMLLATDQEGGRVARLSPELMPQSPSPRYLGQHNAVQEVRALARETAYCFRQVGLTMNLAPVIDVRTNPANNVIGDRSFGNDPGLVSSLGVAYIQELQRNGIIATAKHFPGHGASTEDSHEVIPIAHFNGDDSLEVHLYPFREVIEEGVEAVMTAHVQYPMTDMHPATLSKRFLVEILRDEMGFEGVVISDDLAMRSMSNNYTIESIAVESVNAGTDILLLSGTSRNLRNLQNGLLQAVERGDISVERIDESVERILHMKDKYGLLDVCEEELMMASSVHSPFSGILLH